MNLENLLRTPVFQNYIHSDSVAQKLTQSVKTIYSHSPTNFAVSFSSEKTKRENNYFLKIKLFCWTCFLHPEFIHELYTSTNQKVP